ncbi:MAG TPA: GNAT family N-acetyltransferase, partial [Fimbriimonas sp.]|nr:GNAT family N-acetyltransferase [Fimbriimonas sp.]
ATLVWANEENIGRLGDQFFELHKLRWKSRGLPGAFFGKAESFQKEWMRLALRSDTLRMCILEADGKAVGSIYGMKHGSTTYFYQAGMDPAASSLSPGTILTAALIERAIEDGCTTFDLMRGDEPYKRRWKPGRERVNLRTFVGKNSVLGRAGEAWNRQAWRVELKLRDRFEGKGLKQSKN